MIKNRRYTSSVVLKWKWSTRVKTIELFFDIYNKINKMENYFKAQKLIKTQKNECVKNLNDLIMVINNKVGNIFTDNNLYENKKRG